MSPVYELASVTMLLWRKTQASDHQSVTAFATSPETVAQCYEALASFVDEDPENRFLTKLERDGELARVTLSNNPGQGEHPQPTTEFAGHAYTRLRKALCLDGWEPFAITIDDRPNALLFTARARMAIEESMQLVPVQMETTHFRRIRP